MASWCPFCLHTEAKITDIILIAAETIFFGLSMKALAVLHELHVCWFMGFFFFFRVQKKTTSMSLTIRSASPKTPEALPLRSTLVQALSQPPQRVSPCNTQHSRSTEAHTHCPKSGDNFSVPYFCYCLLDAKPSVVTVWRWSVRSSCIHQG